MSAVADGGQAGDRHRRHSGSGGGASEKMKECPYALALMHQALRCHAKSKRSGLRCQAPAVQEGLASAGMHGAGGGAPKGNRNALKLWGLRSAETIILKRQIKYPSLGWPAGRWGRSTLVKASETAHVRSGQVPWKLMAKRRRAADHVDHDNR